MTKILRIGFLPLLDAGLLFVAAARKFDEAEGLSFELCAETSWANLRDKLGLGIYDAAHMLAPAVVASTLGLDGFAAPMAGAVALGLDGNAISVAPPLAAQMREKADGDFSDPKISSAALAKIVVDRRGRGLPALRFAHVFPFSSHHYQLKLWMALGGVDLEGVRLTVTPPPLMGESLRGGFVNGFCVGEPWNFLGEHFGDGEILTSCQKFAPNFPEKVLAFPAQALAQDPELGRAAARAVRAAAQWGEDPQNFDAFCALISDHLGFVEPEFAARALRAGPTGRWLRLDRASTALSRAQAVFLYALAAANRQAAVSDELAARAGDAFPFADEAAPPPGGGVLGASFEPGRWRDFVAALTPIF